MTTDPLSNPTRRRFMQQLAQTTGGVVLMPWVTSCVSSDNGSESAEKSGPAASEPGEAEAQPKAGVLAVPAVKPADWDPIAYNRARGNAGKIPESYLPSINGPDGVKKHLGKHLPYVPDLKSAEVPSGMLAIMWGDPDKGYVRHPNAARGPENDNQGHWYNWVKVRKAVDGDAEEVENTYPEWPGTSEQREGHFVVYGGGDITADSGKNTVYLVQLPADAKPGDTIRIWAHCLTHGEYVDFIRVPETA